MLLISQRGLLFTGVIKMTLNVANQELYRETGMVLCVPGVSDGLVIEMHGCIS